MNFEEWAKKQESNIGLVTPKTAWKAGQKPFLELKPIMANIIYFDGMPDRYIEAIAKVYGLEVPEEDEDEYS